ncbi:multicopper oxidase type 2 [Halothece sp. PCC 7418]|uniref:multicopper oxidase family protein n=1 Tax=Halothece sp. (strain PCC 7418) TaxID=65093 RepID=UPI0002A0793A|nr:multicopper oxidase family protein [Halothece sp. PCC 7418]AFZ43882.1 multicopper oxidase type 2 [Halothece sp. PCC 7418]
MQRRQFLILSGSTLTGVLLSQCATPQTESNASSATVLKSKNGLLEVDLDLASNSFSFGGKQGNLLSYNGQIPGPRLEVRSGDQVRIRAKNRLSQPTNLHYHGLHISPQEPADNIFLSLSPGESYTYEFKIPENHYSTTGYYHPHLHGYVADQVFGGLGGILVVRGELDNIPEVKQAKEEFVFLKDFDLDGRSSRMGLMMGREGSTVTVNGKVNPSFSLPSGGLLRLRFVNASTSRFYRLQLENHPFYLIATDGGATSSPVELSEILLSPGERAEVLVKGNQTPGNYRLLNLPYNRVGMGMMGGGMMGRGMMGGGRNQNNEPQTLATIRYSGEIESLPLPQKLIAVETLPKPKTVRQFTLNHGMFPGRGMQFLINGQAFDPRRVDTRVSLDTVEDWEIINTGVMDHPFHLHTNRFQVVSKNGKPVSNATWKDTVLVPRGESVRIRIPFQDFAGKTVYHCHILDHEDLGMMGIIVMNG